LKIVHVTFIPFLKKETYWLFDVFTSVNFKGKLMWKKVKNEGVSLTPSQMIF